MKKMFPLALLLCVSFSMSSFAPVHHHTPVVKKSALAITFPITGTTLFSYMDYEINNNGHGTSPYTIRFYNNSTGVPIGTSYNFTHNGPTDPNNHYATGMESATGFTYVVFTISSAYPSGYNVAFIGI